MFPLPKGEAQVVRLLLRARPGDTERAYRVVVDELPLARGGGNVRMALRATLPAFAAPSGAAAPQLHWRVRRQGDRTQILASNAGSRRSRVDELAVVLPDGQRVAPRPIGQLPYVLPGAERRWLIERPGPSHLAGKSLRVVAKTDAGPVEVTLPADAR